MMSECKHQTQAEFHKGLVTPDVLFIFLLQSVLSTSTVGAVDTSVLLNKQQIVDITSGLTKIRQMSHF